MKKSANSFFLLICMALILCVLVLPFAAWAENASVEFASDRTLYNEDDEITVNVRITSPEKIGTYRIELEYDTDRMEYLTGAEEEDDGVILLKGTGLEDTVIYDLSFRAKAPGAAGIRVIKAVVNTYGGSSLEIISPGQVFEIKISGNSSLESFSAKVEKEQLLDLTGIPVSGSVKDKEGNTLYIIDHFQMVPDEVTWDYVLTGGIFRGTELAYITDKNNGIRILGMLGSDNEYHLYAVNQDDDIYPVVRYEDPEGNTFFLAQAKAALSVQKSISDNEDALSYAVYAIPENGNGKIYYVNSDGFLVKAAGSIVRPWMILLLIILLIFAAVIIMFAHLHRQMNKQRSIKEGRSVYMSEPVYEYSDRTPESGEVFMKIPYRPYTHEEILEKTSGGAHKFIYISHVEEERGLYETESAVSGKKIESIIMDEID